MAALGAWSLWPDEGLLNPCLAPDDDRWSGDPLVMRALTGLDFAQVWDSHAHLLPSTEQWHGLEGPLQSALGAHGSEGPWPAVAMKLQARLIANAACADPQATGRLDGYLLPLLARVRVLPAGCKLLLLAMDAHHDEAGRERPERTHFKVPNALCALVARTWPERFEWAASIHPYRPDARDELVRVRQRGARAVKWIPAAQGIDPANPRCDGFYRALAEHRMPLITHGGDERAMAGDDTLGNPLKLRRALDAGVRVIIAHCATMGQGADLDKGTQAGPMSNFALFERLMGEPRYEGLLFGDLAAVGQRARTGPALATLLERASDGGPWRDRILNGTDYPIPGLMPLYSVAGLAAQGFIDPSAVAPLRELRRHNAWLFDFVLKRTLRLQGRGFAGAVFETRRHFS